MPDRKYSASSLYRYGFNGKELDKDIDGNNYDYGFRIYNPQIGRFLSVDPLTRSYPWYTPYQFSGNKPVAFIDMDGAEEIHYIFTWVKMADGKEVVIKLGGWQEGKEIGYDKKTQQVIFDKPYKIVAHYPSDVYLNGQPIFVTANYNSEEEFRNAKSEDFTWSCIDQGINAGVEIGSYYADLATLGMGTATLANLGKELAEAWIRAQAVKVYESVLTKEFLSKQIMQAIDGRILQMDIEAGAKLSAMESFTPEAHFMARHGAQTTLEQQQIRATTGLTPDGFQGGKVNSSRFFSDDLQLEAYEQARTAYLEGKVKDGVYTFDMKKTVGEGYLKLGKKQTSATYTTTTRVTAQYNELGEIITIYPQLLQK